MQNSGAQTGSGKVISRKDRIRFSLAYFLCSLLWMSGLGIVSAVLLPQHLKDVVGPVQATTIFGIINAVTAIASLVSNLLFGNFLTGPGPVLAGGLHGLSAAGSSVA